MFTLSKTIEITGIGIHSGGNVTMQVMPAVKKHGISFILNDKEVPVDVNSIGLNHLRSTTLTHDSCNIQTPEHFLSACYALQLTNIKITLSHFELPILDGSAIEFIHALEPYRVPIPEPQKKLTVSSPISLTLGDSQYSVVPHNDFIIDVTLAYPDHWLQTLTYQYNHSERNYIENISSARTYGFLNEVTMLKEKGLAKGGSLDNALVITDTGYLNDPRFVDEIARHKILDFIGDMAIGQRQLAGHFTITKPSHQGNVTWLKHLIMEETC